MQKNIIIFLLGIMDIYAIQASHREVHESSRADDNVRIVLIEDHSSNVILKSTASGEWEGFSATVHDVKHDCHMIKSIIVGLGIEGPISISPVNLQESYRHYFAAVQRPSLGLSFFAMLQSQDSFERLGLKTFHINSVPKLPVHDQKIMDHLINIATRPYVKETGVSY